MTLKTISQRLNDIKLFLEYAVPQADQARALELVMRHETDIIALNIFEAFYRFLPEAEDDFIKVLRLIARKEGTFLICATACLGNYLYLSSTEKALFIGAHGEGIPDPEVLDFFGFKDNRDFLKKSTPVEKFPVYVPATLQADICPVCNAAHGEYHTLGCPVEVCPWCGGQLTHCECRFRELGQEHIFTESDVEAFAEKLNKKGRIPFDAEEHRPGYLGEPEEQESR